MLSAVAITLTRWPVIGRAAELELFDGALSAADGAGLIINGAAGVGKTRLADECRERAAAGGHPTERVVGSRTAALLPLSAVAALLPGGLARPDADGEVNALAFFEETRHALHDRYHGQRLVLVVDDVSLLDAASLALLGYLVSQRTIFVIATVRTGEPVPDLVTGLWRDGRAERVDLEDLSPTQVDTLLHLTLGGPIEAGSGRELWDASRGNPLYVRELVLGALESGALVERSGVWHLEGKLPSTSRLRDLVQQRIGALTEEARTVVDLLALCQPVELDYLDASAPYGLLESLERMGLVTVNLDNGEVRLAHPLHAEVVRASMPSLRARAILLREADRVEAAGSASGSEALRSAVWRLDAGARPEPELLLRGAQLARHAHDFRLVRRLMEAVPEEQLDAIGSLLLGEALYELGVFDASERVLASGQRLPSTGQLALRLAVTRTKNAFWGLCRPEAALAIVTEARSVLVSEPLAEEVAADEAAIRMFSGQPLQALRVLDRIAGSELRTRVVRAIVAAPVLAAMGRTAEAVTVAETGFADHMLLGDELAIAHPATHIVNQAYALAEAGRLAEAERLAQAGADAVAAYRVPIAQFWFAVTLGRVTLLRGRLGTARRYFAEAAGLAESHFFAGPRRLALAGLAMVSGMLGDADGADAALRDRNELPPFGFLGPEQQLADAWTAVARRRPRDAADLFRSAAAEAAATGHRTAESWLWHDLMRIGGEDASERLRELATGSDSTLVSARARHAVAARARDGHALVAVADDFEAMGANLLAAEAGAQAAEAFRRAGDQRAATAAARRSRALAAICEGAATPGLIRTDAVVPLSEREREIAMLAAEGLASKDIAARLYLSVRTVNNHLQNVYSKLGVSSRTDLARSLGTGP
jgi:DNA-binding NarL/FixJ family response regulator